MVKSAENFETLTDNSRLTEKPVAKYCQTFKGIIEKSKRGEKFLRTSRRWEKAFKIHHKEKVTEDVEWNYVALDGCKMCAFVNAAIKFRILQKNR